MVTSTIRFIEVGLAVEKAEELAASMAECEIATFDDGLADRKLSAKHW
jgi:hypothetical protein